MNKKCFANVLLTLVCFTLSATSALAWHVSGTVRCEPNGLPVSGAVVTVKGVGGTVFSGSATTEGDGFYAIVLPDTPGSYEIAVAPPNGASVTSPTPHPFPFSLTDVIVTAEVNFLVTSEACANVKCWLTGGGAKFSTITNGTVAEHGPQHSFGGNVNPGCNTDSGEGGQWNHVAHALKLHFQGLQIEVVRCGNVSDLPPGSESPATPFNFIEFKGTGVLKGIHGNNIPKADVQFFGRAEDRNEPGGNGAKDGARIDRYFLHVWDGSGTRLLIDVDGNPLTVDPVTITDGNLQIHISSCSVP